MEGYKTIKDEATAEIEIKHSKFIATVIPCETENQAMEFVAKIRKKYWDAKHNVYAFSLKENSLRRYSDDGEPHSTAGLPVLKSIIHSGLENIAVVVTRYFGGILLGTGGLVRAYSEAAKTALENAQVVTITKALEIVINCDYSDYDVMLKVFEPFNITVFDTEFAEKVKITIGIDIEKKEKFTERIIDTFCGRIEILPQREIFLGV